MPDLGYSSGGVSSPLLKPCAGRRPPSEVNVPPTLYPGTCYEYIEDGLELHQVSSIVAKLTRSTRPQHEEG